MPPSVKRDPCAVRLCPSGNAAPVHCRRRKPKCVEDVHAGIFCHPSLALPGESLREHRKDLRKPERHFKLALLWREGIGDRKTGNPFHREPPREGQKFDRADLLARSLPAPRPRDGKILDYEQGGLVTREKLIHLAKQATALRGYDPPAPIREECRSFEDDKGESP